MEFNNDKFTDNLEKITQSLTDTYYYIKSVSKYYWKEQKKFYKPNDAGNNIMCTNKELNWLRAYWIIETFDDVCYLKGWKKWCLNLLEEEKILLPSNNPILDNDIKKLIESVWWGKNENIEYLHKAILYKYLNINDFTIPSIVFYWAWWSWKWAFIILLKTIFWEDNVMPNLWQRELLSTHDTYKGQKLIVEFAEVTTNSSYSDIKILNRLKNIIWAEKITVNEKWIQAYQIENIAWFFISSNSNKPLQLDDKDKWNRRFTIIKSTKKLENWEEVSKTITRQDIVSNYLAWLLKNFPEVKNYKKLEALDNQDKRDLEERSQHEANNFWERLNDNYPEIKWKKTKLEIEDYILKYCIENNLDNKEFLRYFWNNSKYSKKKIRIWERTYYWVEI